MRCLAAADKQLLRAFGNDGRTAPTVIAYTTVAPAGVLGPVPVVAMDGAGVSTFGGPAARDATSPNVAGVIMDGARRDLDEIRATGLFLASRHVTPRSGRRRVRVAETGGTLTCGGVTVNSGDCVIGDETGVVIVPAGRLLEALALAEELTARDRSFEQALDAGAEFGVVAGKLRHL